VTNRVVQPQYTGRGFCAALTFAGRLPFRVVPVRQPPHIVFVCEHGGAKSVLAASYFNDLEKARTAIVARIDAANVIQGRP